MQAAKEGEKRKRMDASSEKVNSELGSHRKKKGKGRTLPASSLSLSSSTCSHSQTYTCTHTHPAPSSPAGWRGGSSESQGDHAGTIITEQHTNGARESGGGGGGSGRGGEIGYLPGPQTVNSGDAHQTRHRTPNFRARTVGGTQTADPAALYHTWGGGELSV